MRDGAAHEGCVQHARQHEIGDILPLAEKETPVLAAQQRAPDMSRFRIRHQRDPEPRIFCAAAATERTMSR